MKSKGGLQCYRFSNGVLYPCLGLGTWQLAGAEVDAAIRAAYKIGYRHIDSAHIYKNYPEIGSALKELEAGDYDDGITEPGIRVNDDVIEVSHADFTKNFALPHGKPEEPRKIFVTGKVWVNNLTPAGVRSSVATYLKELQRSIADLILLHWPGDPTNLEVHVDRISVWRELEKLYAEKKVRAIGVSNFMSKHLTPLIENVQKRAREGDKDAMMPMVNQIEIAPTCTVPQDLAELCQQHKIILGSYCTLGGPKGAASCLENEVLRAIGDAHGMTPAQVALRWAMQRGYVVIPKSKNANRLQENFDALRLGPLSSADLAALDGLDEKRRSVWDPNNIP